MLYPIMQDNHSISTTALPDSNPKSRRLKDVLDHANQALPQDLEHPRPVRKWRKLVPHLKGEPKPRVSEFEQLLMEAESVPQIEKDYLVRRKENLLNLQQVHARIQAEAEAQQNQKEAESTPRPPRLHVRASNLDTKTGRKTFQDSLFAFQKRK